MGVLGLWQLLKPASRQTKLEGLEGKTIAVDISIWLYQATKGVRNSSNGHLLVLYNRICKLLYFKVKPIFVFDGPDVPNLKQRVLQERQKRRNAASDKGKALDEQIKRNILEAHALKSVLGEDCLNEENRKLLKSNRQSRSENIDDIFVLPDQSSIPTNLIDDDVELLSTDNDKSIDEDEDENQIMFEENFDINKVDPEVFESLPDDLKIELLTQYKEKLKNKKSQTFNDFPQKSTDFSDYQMKLLLHKSEITNKLNAIKDTMKANYSVGTSLGDFFHQKVVSEDDRELILMTRKKTANIFNFNENENESDESINVFGLAKDKFNSESSDSDEGKPTFKIQFDLRNKIELVPRKEIESEPIEIDDLKKLNENLENEQDMILSLNENKEDEIKEKDNNSETSQIKNVQLLSASTKINELNKIQSNGELSTKNKENISSGEDDDDFVEVTIPNKKTDDFLIEDIAKLTQLTKSNAKNIHTLSITSTESTAQQETFAESQPCTSTSIDKKVLADNLCRIQANNSILLESDEDSDLAKYNEYLAKETTKLIKEKQNVDRLSNSIERYVIDDAKQLLRLFGLPFVESPGEAEAQCAYLDFTDQTDGSITEDSDVWLFGGKRVYKNFFGNDQFIEFYSDQVIKTHLGLDREDLIDIAFLVGSDYTLGVEHVGIVKAIEILQEFDGNGIEKLKKLKEWHSCIKDKVGATKNLSKIKSSLLKINLPDSFPNDLVFKAYIAPNVDKSREKFSWSMPDLHSIRKFLMNKMNWSSKKIDDDLLPVIKRMSDTKVQKTIDNFFTSEIVSKLETIQSKRMKNAIKMFKTKSSDSIRLTNRSDLNLSENEDDEIVEITNQGIASTTETSNKQPSKKVMSKRQTKPKPKKQQIEKAEPSISEVDSESEEEYAPAKQVGRKRKSSESRLSNKNNKQNK